MLDICRKTVNHLWPDALRDRGALCNDLYKTTLLIHCHQGFGLASSEVTIYVLFLLHLNFLLSGWISYLVHLVAYH